MGFGWCVSCVFCVCVFVCVRMLEWWVFRWVVGEFMRWVLWCKFRQNFDRILGLYIYMIGVANFHTVIHIRPRFELVFGVVLVWNGCVSFLVWAWVWAPIRLHEDINKFHRSEIMNLNAIQTNQIQTYRIYWFCILLMYFWVLGSVADSLEFSISECCKFWITTLWFVWTFLLRVISFRRMIIPIMKTVNSWLFSRLGHAFPNLNRFCANMCWQYH